MPEKKMKKRKVFQIAAPEANAVYLAGDFNGWKPDVRPLKEGRNGIWKTTLTLPPGIYEYRFVVDGEWCDDPRCDEKAPNSLGSENCLLHL
ncbi:MAG: 1,4-alpha-glucan branching enzyme [Candidatus Latescibacterota bacterium]|jgi:1,4-alpha-glucan branching enzyme